jgi:hypothetical protein
MSGNIFGTPVSDWLTAIATVIIAAFTATIYFINRNQLRHAHQVERAYIFGGGAAVPSGTQFRFDINNYGKTPGYIVELRWEFCEADAIPPRPIYGPPHFYYDSINANSWSGGIHSINVPPTFVNPVIYGRYYYRDVFNKSHSSGFILQINPTNGETKPARAPAVYTDERDEPEPDQNLSYHA